MDILGFLIFMVVAAVCAWIADLIVPGTIPGGFLAAAVVGVIGAWMGTAIFGSFGPELGGVSVLPAIIGSGILIFVLALVARGRATRV
jgi:uncharacterized membrane protein YeaQ/YmgE (transglycosylase-associated protein family)